MDKKWILATITASFLIIGGCSEKEMKPHDSSQEQELHKKEPETATDKDTKTIAQVEEKDSENTIDEKEIEEIRNIIIPDSLDGFKEQTPGIFTLDIPFEEETKQMWGNFGLGNYEEELTNKLAAFTSETNEPTDILKALHYYLGSNAFNRSISEIKDFGITWYEPYLPEPEEMQSGLEETALAPSEVYILLDASGSMYGKVEGMQKMHIAKRAASRFAATVGNEKDISLVVYGHTGSNQEKDKQLSCSKIEEVYPLQKFNPEAFSEAVNTVQARGWTPLASAIDFVLKKTENSSNNVTLYIISDGIETCDGDPVATAKAFADRQSNRAVNIIGFDVDAESENQLKDVASAGNGEYISAKTIEELDNSITNKWVPSFQEIMSKSNSLIKHWGQMNDAMRDREKLAGHFYYAATNERSRFISALQIMRSENMITPETYDTLIKAVDKKWNLSAELKNELSTENRKKAEVERQKIIQKVNNWTQRMNELRKSQ
ncbi:VWA domain-containing protein [Fredinandcohnia sp. QZ13]|uniref:VWA domain-containing protein n=1 Tax=Fredinandcohnia sp. QZ13 TaxID=3073144 RepID=UPI0028530285|nr:VWA domain-containing protein [Fredinandcohnia sp. QZ13]MDR4889141.1 VWA domain-containing protein [Fredinandcohnia sp. QZ13]